MSELQVPDNDDIVFTEDEYEEEEDDDRVQHGEIIFLNLTLTINLKLKTIANRFCKQNCEFYDNSPNWINLLKLDNCLF